MARQVVVKPESTEEQRQRDTALRPRLLREVVGRYQEQIGSAGHLLLEIVGTPLAVSADPDRIEQVLTNLLDNAIKYSPDGAELQIVLRAPEGCPDNHLTTDH